jgi:hypothetical protein
MVNEIGVPPAGVASDSKIERKAVLVKNILRMKGGRK